jgi:hypothetical protein
MDLGLEPSEHVLYGGVNQNIPIGRLEPGESRAVDTIVCFLALGCFEISAEVKLVGSELTQIAGSAILKVSLTREQ